jgi:tetratricopeptide (TPR) repeat protein
LAFLLLLLGGVHERIRMMHEMTTQNFTEKTSPQKSTNLLSQFDEHFLFKNALILVDHGDYELALNLLDTVLAENEFHLESLKWKGYCLTQVGKIEKAIEAYFKLAEISPSDTNYFNLAEAFYTSGQDVLAKEFYNKSLEVINYESPHLFQIYKKLGNVATKAGDFDAAQEFFDKAYTITPHSDDLFVNYGTLEMQKDNHDEALERFKHALTLNKTNDKAWIGLALIYRARGDSELAWGELLHALDLNPKNAVGVKLAIDWGMYEMEYDKAIAVLERYLNVAEPNADWVYTYAGLLYQAGDWKESKKILELLLAEKPRYMAAKELLKKIDHKSNV